MATTFLLLHGIRTDNRSAEWRSVLDRACRRHDVDTLEERGWNVVQPSYLDLLEGADAPDRVEKPRKAGYVAADPLAAAAFWRNQRNLELALGRRDDLAGWGAQDDALAKIAEVALAAPVFEQARVYGVSPVVRRKVLDRVLDELGSAPVGDLVLVGYSLGSLVAASLVQELPPHLTLRLVVTLGSPLRHRSVHGHLTDSFRTFPYSRVGAWLNLRGQFDPVPAGRSLGSFIPQVVDRPVDTGSGLQAHALEGYVDQADFVRALEWVARRPSREVVGHSVELDPRTLRVVVGTQWALREEQALPATSQKDRELRARLAAARGLVTDETAGELRRAGVIHPVISRLDRDNRDLLRERLSPTETVAALISAYLQNPVAPYGVGVPDDVRDSALDVLATDLGVSTGWSDTVIRTWDRVARDGKTMGIRPQWALAAVAGVGLALVAPIAVLAAAPVGLVGGAAIVAGLAALGPGGMAGGLGIVALIGGTGGVVAGGGVMGLIATRGSVPEVKQSVDIACVLASVRAELTDESRGDEWTMLVLMRDQLAAELERHRTISDQGAPVVKSLEAKSDRVRRGIGWLEKNGLTPPALLES